MREKAGKKTGKKLEGKNRMGNTIRMIGIDLDGTLLTKQKVLTAVSRSALEEAINKGIEVVPVTGRPLAGVPHEVLDIPGIRYVITSNGANTYDLSEHENGKGSLILSGTMDGKTPGTVLRKAHMPHEVVRRILEAAPGQDVIREIFVRGVGYHDARTQLMLEARFGIAPPILAYINRSRKVVSGFDELLEDPSSHVENVSLMFSSQEARDASFARIKNIRGSKGERILTVLLPFRTDLEVTHVHADKWRSLEELGTRLGITDSQIMTLGDGDNDRPMLRGAGLSVAMGNAPDFVKETANLVTGDNEHDGAAQAIREVLGL